MPELNAIHWKKYNVMGWWLLLLHNAYWGNGIA